MEFVDCNLSLGFVCFGNGFFLRSVFTNIGLCMFRMRKTLNLKSAVIFVCVLKAMSYSFVPKNRRDS